MSETACRSGDAKLKTEADATAFPLIRPRRAHVTGQCNVRWSRTLNPQGFCFLGWAEALASLYGRRDGRHLHYCAKDSLQA